MQKPVNIYLYEGSNTNDLFIRKNYEELWKYSERRLETHLKNLAMNNIDEIRITVNKCSAYTFGKNPKEVIYDSLNVLHLACMYLFAYNIKAVFGFNEKKIFVEFDPRDIKYPKSNISSTTLINIFSRYKVFFPLEKYFLKDIDSVDSDPEDISKYIRRYLLDFKNDCSLMLDWTIPDKINNLELSLIPEIQTNLNIAMLIFLRILYTRCFHFGILIPDENGLLVLNKHASDVQLGMHDTKFYLGLRKPKRKQNN